MPAQTTRRATIVAIFTGLLGILMAIAAPLMPVNQTTAEINWPQDGQINSVTAPLVSYVPIDFDATVPCAAVDDLGDGTVLLSTTPLEAEKATARGLIVRLAGERDNRYVEVIDRNIPVVSAPLTEVTSPDCREITVTATHESVEAEFVGLTDGTGQPLTGSSVADDEDSRDDRPQVTGLFTDLTGPADELPGLSAHVTIDSRYSTSPTLLKWLVLAIGVLATISSLIALATLDATDGRRHRRIFPARWWRLKPRDFTVIGLLLVWHLIGPNTSDDGYLLTMSRVAQDADYTANYFRWYAAPEAPFGWYYQAFGLLGQISMASPWIRLPALLCGIACWLIVSHEVLPRLGRAATRPAVAWTAALVFLAAWFPFNNGLRPEPIICLGALLTWCSVERAIATGRLLPAAVACTFGAFSLAAGPTGLLAVAALIAGARPMMLALLRRAKAVAAITSMRTGTVLLALLAPIVAAGVAVVFVVFSNLTLRSFSEASAMKSALGPSLNWYNEISRYSSLFGFSADGSIARRFAVLTMFLCLVVAAAILIRKSHIPGTAVGPARRIVGITFASLLFLMFTPTKWTHHFGVFAGLAAALAAIAAIAAGPAATRSRRNRTIFAALVVFVTGMAFTAPNSYYYTSAWGMPWGGSQVFEAVKVGQILLYLSLALLALALWFHFREPFTGTDPAVKSAVRQQNPRLARTRSRLHELRPGPLAIAAAAVVAFQVVTAAVAGANQGVSSVPQSNLAALGGRICGMADNVWVETDPSDFQLTPVDAAVEDPLAGPVTAPADADRGATTGFLANGVPEDLNYTASEGSLGVLSHVAVTDPKAVIANPGGTGGGYLDSPGVNGSLAALPFGLDPAVTPVMGSWSEVTQRPSQLTTAWYRLPADFHDHPLITFSAAGTFPSEDLRVQYTLDPITADTPDSALTPAGEEQVIDPGPAPSWRNVRLYTGAIPDGATAIRIVADDRSLSPDRFIVVTPPRLPDMQTLQEVVGNETPVHLDWTSGLVFPCQRPFNHTAGVAELPQWRIRPGSDLAAAVSAWQAAPGGGPLGWLEVSQEAEAMASYLEDDVGRDWGALERYVPYPSSDGQETPVPAQIDYSEHTRSGLWSPSPIRY